MPLSGLTVTPPVLSVRYEPSTLLHHSVLIHIDLLFVMMYFIDKPPCELSHVCGLTIAESMVKSRYHICDFRPMWFPLLSVLICC